VTAPQSARPFNRSVQIFFALVLLGLGIAVISDAPLAFDAASHFFLLLDHHQFVVHHHRFINIPLQIPMLAATWLTQNARVFRLIYCATYASVPALSLAASWLICRSRRPSLFIWPAMSICIGALPGQLYFTSECILSATLMWPALLGVLLAGPALAFPLVAIASIAAALSHPCAAIPLAFTMLVAIVSAIVRPRVRKPSLWFASGAGALLLVRTVAPLDKYESQRLSLHTVVLTLREAVFGWPLVALGFTFVAALICLTSAGSFARRLLAVPLCLAGLALAVWATSPADWMRCSAYKYWVPPVSLIFMTAAAWEVLRPGALAQPQPPAARLEVLPVIGAVFLLVLSIQSLQWGRMSRRLTQDLVASDRGCVSRTSVAWIRQTALDWWTVTFYAADLQGRRPRTLLLADDRACGTFARTGDATFVDNGSLRVVRGRGSGWFDFEDARSKTERPPS
jgi:hypothetical protein